MGASASAKALADKWARGSMGASAFAKLDFAVRSGYHQTIGAHNLGTLPRNDKKDYDVFVAISGKIQ